MSLNWEELLLRIIGIPSMINVLLNLGYNVSGYLSVQNEMACFPNSWGILLYKFVTLNVTMSVLVSIFRGAYICKTRPLVCWAECSPMVRETRVQS